MKPLRITLLACSGLIGNVLYFLLFRLISRVHPPGHHDLLGYGIWLELTCWCMLALQPISIGLGELWFPGNWKRWIPQLALLVALVAWSTPGSVMERHPLRAGLFLASAFFVLVMRWVMDLLIAVRDPSTLHSPDGQ